MKCFVILFFCLPTFFQTIQHYQNREKDYSIDIPQTAKAERINLNKPGIYADKFSVYNNAGATASYAFIIAKMTGAGKQGLILNDSFKNGFLNTCGCEIVESKEANFKKFKAIQIKTKSSQTNGEVLMGYTIQLIKSENLYNISFSTSEKAFAKEGAEFLKMMDSFEPLK